MGYFRNPEHEPTRVQKLNTLEQRVTTLEDLGAILEIDGGDAFVTGTPDISLDGGTA